MLHPHTELRLVDALVGQGVFATAPIPQGTVIWVLDALDQVLTPAATAQLSEAYAPLLARYTFEDALGNRILCWDEAKLMNHACDPNCVGTEFGFELAVRDIAPGEQLTNDYATLHLRSHELFECRCGAPGCRGKLTTALDPERRLALREGFAVALDLLAQRPQPLGALLDSTRLAEARAAVAPLVLR